VISPEGCASILWRTPDKATAAAVAMKMTAAEQQTLGVVDVVVPEPAEGAQADHAETARRLKAAIVGQLQALGAIPLDELVEARYRRYRALGSFSVISTPTPPAPERPGFTDRLRGLLGSGRSAVPGASSRGVADRGDEQPPAREEV